MLATDLIARPPPPIPRPYGLQWLRLDGGTAPAARGELARRFNRDPTVDALLLTTGVRPRALLSPLLAPLLTPPPRRTLSAMWSAAGGRAGG